MLLTQGIFGSGWGDRPSREDRSRGGDWSREPRQGWGRGAGFAGGYGNRGDPGGGGYGGGRGSSWGAQPGSSSGGGGFDSGSWKHDKFEELLKPPVEPEAAAAPPRRSAMATAAALVGGMAPAAVAAPQSGVREADSAPRRGLAGRDGSGPAPQREDRRRGLVDSDSARRGSNTEERSRWHG